MHEMLRLSRFERDGKKSERKKGRERERRSADVKVRGSRSADVKVGRCRSAGVKV